MVVLPSSSRRLRGRGPDPAREPLPGIPAATPPRPRGSASEAHGGPFGALWLGALLLGACTSGAAAPAKEAFDEARAWRDLERIVAFGERPSGSARNRELRAWLEQELRGLGLETVREPFRATTPIGELEFENLWADVAPPGGAAAGGEPPIVVLATHFDTKRLPFRFVGANDGGSGTAVLLELARVLVAAERPRSVTYRLLFLDGEEAVRPWWEDPDNTYGSRHHVEQLRRDGGLRRIAACVLLDMVGDADLRLTSDSSSTPELLELFFAAAREAGLGRHVDGTRKEVLDDHLPFLAAGIPSVDLIDLEYGGPGNPVWHTEADTLERCSAASLGAAGRIVLSGLPRLERWIAER